MLGHRGGGIKIFNWASYFISIVSEVRNVQGAHRVSSFSWGSGQSPKLFLFRAIYSCKMLIKNILISFLIIFKLNFSNVISSQLFCVCPSFESALAGARHLFQPLWVLVNSLTYIIIEEYLLMVHICPITLEDHVRKKTTWN